MKKIFWLFLLTSSVCTAQLSPSPLKLSNDAVISVVTCGPYQGELYSAFGHSAFRVYDPTLGINAIYNYGVFDYDQPNFYLNFALGKNSYMLGLQDYDRFRDVYIYYNRFIHEQPLNLNQHQLQKLFAFLEWNARPENQYYYYDYFYDNCATRMRDVMTKNFGDSINFKTEQITPPDYSIRQLTDLYLQEQPWGDLGIDICLGLPMDKKASPLEYMFLPDYIETGFENATIKSNGGDVPLVKEKVITYESRDEEAPKRLPHPLYVFGFLAAIAIALAGWDIKRKKLSNWFDSTLFTTVGLIGILLLFLWFFTDHKAAAKNFNLLWAFPVHLVAGLAVFKVRRWLKPYFIFTAVLCILILVFWKILPQMLHYALIPIVITLGIRASVQYYVRNKTA
jgi:hypothetical protein